MQSLSSLWGREGFAATWNPSQAHNLPVLRWYAKFQRALGSPRAVAENLQFASQMDARSILPKITVPTLVLARRDFAIFPPAQGRVIADGIAGARYAELTGGDADFFWQGTQEALALIEEFMTGAKPVTATERILATVLFTDIVDSTRRAAKLGDNAWRSLLDTHDHLVRQLINHCGGRLVDATGDGTLAVFTMPGAAIDCAHALNTALAKQDIAIRAGLHIGELELREEGRVGGMAVHIGARVLGRAEAGEVLVSRTVRDVMIGSSYKFRERGIHELKGVPSKWPLYAVLDAKEG